MWLVTWDGAARGPAAGDLQISEQNFKLKDLLYQVKFSSYNLKLPVWIFFGLLTNSVFRHWFCEWRISAISTCLVTRDGRIDRNLNSSISTSTTRSFAIFQQRTLKFHWNYCKISTDFQALDFFFLCYNVSVLQQNIHASCVPRFLLLYVMAASFRIV